MFIFFTETRIPNMRTEILHNRSLSPCNNYVNFNHDTGHQQLRDQFYNTPSSRYSDTLNVYPNNGHIEEYDGHNSHGGNQQEEIHRSPNFMPYHLPSKPHEVESLKKVLNQREDEINNLKREIQLQRDQIDNYNVSKRDLQQTLGTILIFYIVKIVYLICYSIL